MQVLSEPEWHARREAHQRRLRRWIDPRLARASRNEHHPIEDFLFEYYAYRPGKLLQWHPGIDVVLAGGSAGEYLRRKGYARFADGIAADASQLPFRRVEAVLWLRDMLLRSRERPALLACWGLHEWAMVYRTESIRHAQWPLRLPPRQIAEIVESLGPRCTHYDAFRFFSAAARPLNKFQPARPTVAALEQPGCLHANMDLYKWAFKLAPFTASELVADCFELAAKIRTLDMQASPYDFTGLGYLPIKVETPEGRAEYESGQREFALRASPLRDRLVAVCDAIIKKVPLPSSPSKAGLQPSGGEDAFR